MLTYLNNKFINSSFKSKIELYLLPLMLLYLMYYLSISLKNDNKLPKIKNNINISEYLNRKFDGSFLDLFSIIENSAKELDMQVISLDNSKNIIELKVEGKTKSLLTLIRKIENMNSFTKIDSISIYNKNDLDLYSFDLKIDLNKFYIKKLIIKEKVKENIKEEDLKEEKVDILVLPLKAKVSYKINAIIAEYVLINSIWLKKGENIDNLKLTEINRNYVILKNDNKKIKLELQNEDYIKNIY